MKVRECFLLNHKFLLTLGAVVMVTLSGCRLYADDSANNPQINAPKTGETPTEQTPDPIRSMSEPFSQGEVIVKNNTIYRQYLGLTDHNNYIVQDFYSDTQSKRTDPYVMIRLDELQTILFEDSGSLMDQYKRLTESGVGIDGPYVQWYRNQSQAIDGDYAGNLPSGVWLLSYENGSPMLQDTWLNGIRNGLSKGWHQNGQLAGQGDYLQNVRNGVWTVWYSNGAKMQEGTYMNGLQDGLWTFWFDNGAPKEAGNYVNGSRIGKWQWWTRNGVLAREGEYDELGHLKGNALGSGVIRPRNF